MTNTETTTYQVIDRNDGTVLFEGTYDDCRKEFKSYGYGCSIKKSDEPIWDEDGNYNAIESN